MSDSNSEQRFHMYEFSGIMINVFDCRSVDGRRKHSKKCAFPKENVLVQTHSLRAITEVFLMPSEINKMWMKGLTFDLRHQAKAAPSLPFRIAFILIVLQMD